MTASKPIMAVSKSHVGYYISVDVIVALMFDNSFGTARFLQVKHKASRTRVYALVLYKNAFPIYRFSSLCFYRKASAWSENAANIIKYFNTDLFSPFFSLKKHKESLILQVF